jgi:hypothetical protein
MNCLNTLLLRLILTLITLVAAPVFAQDTNGESTVVNPVTLDNPSFETGPRRELLALLHKWREELTATAERELRQKRRCIV